MTFTDCDYLDFQHHLNHPVGFFWLLLLVNSKKVMATIPSGQTQRSRELYFGNSMIKVVCLHLTADA